MNLVQLKYFIAVCEFGTVSAAAEHLHISQPSLSLAIRELENEFGALLFRRMHKGMRPTAEGELLFNMAKDIIERTETAEKIMRDIGHSKKTLRLGVPPMIGYLILPVLYGAFLSQNPDISLDIAECGRDEMLKLIDEDKLDMAFISHNKLPNPDIELLPLASLELVCAVSVASPFCQRTVLSPHDLKNIPLILYKDGFFQSSEIKDWFSKGGTEPNILMKTNQLSTMTKIISSNTAVGFLFERLTEGDDKIASIPLNPPIKEDISLIWKKNNFPLTAAKSLKSFLKNTKLFT